MILGVADCVDGDETVRHNASTSIDGASQHFRGVFERVGEVDAISIGHLAIIETVKEVFLVIGAFAVGLLYTASTGGVVVSYGEANHGAVREGDGTLHQSLAERTSSDDVASVPVLYGTRDNLGSRSGIIVDEHHQTPFAETSAACSCKLLTRYPAPLGIDDKLSFFQEFVGNVNGCLQVAAPIVLKIEDEVFHPFLQQIIHSLSNFVV